MSPSLKASHLRLLLVWTLTALVASALPPYRPTFKLIAQPEAQLSVSPQNVADFDLGRISLLDTPTIAHIFTVRNEGVTPVTVTQLQTTCHCTYADLQEVAGRKTSLAEQPFFVLEPGQDAKIKMTVQLARQVPGRVTQSIYLYVDEANAPVSTLRLVCDLEHGLTANPGSIDLGPVKPGEVLTRTITIKFDPRLTGKSGLPALASQPDPHIPSTAEPLVKITAEKPAEPLPGSPALLAQSFTITIKPTHAGDLAARIYFPEFSRSDYKGSLPYDIAAPVFSGLVIPILAQVVEK